MRVFLRPLALVFLISLAHVEVRAQSAANSDPPPEGRSSRNTPGWRSARAVDENGHVTPTDAGKAEIEVTYVRDCAATRPSIPVDSWILRKADQSDQGKNSISSP
jgi:hypothetical protein